MTAISSSAAFDAPTRLRAGRISLIAGTAIFLGKLSAWILTDSTAVLSDAMESVVNVVAAALLLFSQVVASRPADRDHPYGHGKVEFFSAGIEGTLIVVAAAVIATEAARALWTGAQPHRLDLGLLLLSVFSAGNLALGLYLVRVGRRTGSAALLADGRHVLTDVWTTAGVLVGLLLVWLTDWAPLDPLVALAVAGNIVREGWKLARDAVHGLMDAADEELLSEITERLEAARGEEWIDVHGLRTWRAGASVHVDLHVEVPRYLSAEHLHRVHDKLERALADLTEPEGDLVAHFDPCRPIACPRCCVSDCPVRESLFVSRPPITVKRATRMDPDVDHGQGAGTEPSSPS